VTRSTAFARPLQVDISADMIMPRACLNSA
jgi:hypothetical protein